jgi:arsenate reductase (thioredoxin)
MPKKKKILFLCTANSIRSQMAEGLMEALGNDEWEVHSAGSMPSFVHPLAIHVMAEIGIDISHHNSKPVIQFLNEDFDYVVTLCDFAAAVCPTIPGKGRRLHWPIDDPIGVIGLSEQKLAAFRKARDEIRANIEAFLKSNSF